MTNTLDTIKDLLSANWVPANTNGVTPTFIKIFDKKRFGGYNEVNVLAVYHPAGSQHQIISMDAGNERIFEFVRIDIRASGTGIDYDHVVNSKAEAIRIIQVNDKVITGFDFGWIQEDKDLSDGTRNFWRWIIDVKLENNCAEVSS